MKTRTSFGFAVLMVFVLVLPQLAMAAGTDTNFNTTITNSVTIQYGSGPSTITTSTSVDFVVDRVLDWVVAPTVATTLDVFENTTGNAVAFSVRNDTNGPVDILLSLTELTDTPAAVGLFVANPLLIAKALAATGIIALVYSLLFLRSERSLEVVFGILYAYFAMFCLPWVQPFATVTVRRNGWLTR